MVQQGARMTVCTQAAVHLYVEANPSPLLKGSLVLRAVLKHWLYILETLTYNLLCFGKVGMLNLDA